MPNSTTDKLAAAKPDYVTALESAYGAPSQAAFGSAVFYGPGQSAPELEEAALALTDEQYAIAVNPARPELLDRFNAALLQIQADGTYSQIFEKWFGSP